MLIFYIVNCAECNVIWGSGGYSKDCPQPYMQARILMHLFFNWAPLYPHGHTYPAMSIVFRQRLVPPSYTGLLWRTHASRCYSAMNLMFPTPLTLRAVGRSLLMVLCRESIETEWRLGLCPECSVWSAAWLSNWGSFGSLAWGEEKAPEKMGADSHKRGY